MTRWSLLLCSVSVMTTLAFIGFGDSVPWRSLSRMYGLAPTLVAIGVLILTIASGAREVVRLRR